MEFVINSNTIIGLAGLITALGIIIGVIKKFNMTIEKYESYDSEIKNIKTDIKDLKSDFSAEIKAIKAEQQMQTTVLEAVLEGLHQLGCNGPTTKAHDELKEFINKRAHDA